MNYKIIGAEVLVPCEDGLETVKKDLYIKDGKIAAIGKNPDDETLYETIDATGKLVMPGLINMHNHVYMTLFRNYADDVNFDEWLFKRIMPVEDTLSPEAAYWSSLFGCMEMIRSGTTCFMDMHMFKGQSARACRDVGMRAYIGRSVVGEDLYADGLKRFNDVLEEQAEFESDMLKFVLAPHAVYTASQKLYSQVAEEAAKRGMLKHTHLSETDNEVQNCLKNHGKTPLELLDEVGFVDKNASFAHCVKLTPSDIELMVKRGASVVTNPASNAKLGNGFAPINAMRAAGVNVCLGTDSTASNNTLNMFREMGLLSLIHKGLAQDSVAAPAKYVLDTATRHSAKALSRAGELGVIAAGAQADLVFVDLKAPSLFPNNNIVSSLCYSANGSEVESVMIGGKFVMKNREFVNIDEQKVYAEMQKAVDKYL